MLCLLIVSESVGRTDTGKVRPHNEDAFYILPEQRIMLVADGMGGHNAGEVASMNATESVNNYFTSELLSEISVSNKYNFTRPTFNCHILA